jgi:drug/metabolite transporter (DMT)-like permease
MLKWWTLGKATGVGAVAGVAALLLWPAYVVVQEPLLVPYVMALATAAFCGASILWITAADLLFHRRRGERLIPMRVFDVALALLLVIPSTRTLNVLLA